MRLKGTEDFYNAMFGQSWPNGYRSKSYGPKTKLNHGYTWLNQDIFWHADDFFNYFNNNIMPPYKDRKRVHHYSDYDDDWQVRGYSDLCECERCESERLYDNRPRREREIPVQWKPSWQSVLPRDAEKSRNNRTKNIHESSIDTIISRDRYNAEGDAPKIESIEITNGALERSESPRTRAWRSRLFLTDADRDQLIGGDMLTDKHVWAAQHLIREKYPHIGGLQDPLLAQAHCLRACRRDVTNVQIHHTGRLHWVTSWSSPSCGDVVRLYDSLECGDVSDSLKQQLLSVYEKFRDGDQEESTLVVVAMPTGLQQGSVDCGLFAIANAVCLAEGRNPEHVRFDQSQMRAHLLRCFEEEQITPFPELREDDCRPSKRHKEEIVLLST